MPNFFHQSKIFRLSLIFFLFQFVFTTHFSQTTPSPSQSQVKPSPEVSAPKPHPETTLDKSPPESSLPNPAPVEPDDESLLTFLLSEKSRNLHKLGAVTQFHGLPSDRVRAIAQTADGILWFGTDLGLAKFDGRRVETVAAENFANLRILALKTDAHDTLWIGTERGAFRLWRKAFQMVPQTADAPINDILFDPQNRAFLAAENGFVFQVSQAGENDLETKVIFERNFPVKSLALTTSALLIGTHSAGLFAFADGQTAEITNRPRPFFINALAIENGGKLWLGANSTGGESGLYVTDDLRENRRVGERVGTISALVFDENLELLVGTRENGAFLFRGAEEIKHFTFENTAGGLRANEILSVFVDRESVVWFGTTKGVSRFDPHSFSAEQISVESRSNFIRTIYQNRSGKIFVGTQRGLFVSETAGEWRAVEGFQRRTIYSIAETAGENLLLGTVRGLAFYPPENSDRISRQAEETLSENSENQPPAGSVRGIQQFQNKTFLAIFDQGLATLEGGGPKLVSTNSPDLSRPTALKSDADRKLWIGTAENGVFFFDGKGISSAAQLDILKNRAIWALEGSENSGLWFGTQNGLFLLANGVLETVMENIAVRGIALSTDANGVWCATDQNGLIRVSRDKDFGWISSRLDVEQGMPSQRVFTISKLADETLLIGTNRGIVRYKPPQKAPILLPTRVLSRRIHAPEELNTPITLEYPQNTLTLDVSAVSSRTFPEQFQYGFLLRDGRGQILRKKFGKESQFLMDNLPAGDYRVEARAFDKNLFPAEPFVFEFKIERAPFPWITLALTILLLLALVALIWAIYTQKRIFRQSAELTQANLALSTARLDLANEAERERRRISRDLHDQTLADLRHLQLLADKLPQTEETAEKAKVFRHEIENVSHEIRRICEDLSPSVLENIGFAAALEWALSNSLDTGDQEKRFETEFVFSEKLEETLRLAPSVQIQIYRIVQEVLSNIARHSKAEKVRMTVDKTPQNALLLQIEDDGKFFDPARTSRQKGRGLSNIKSRAALIDAEISWSQTAPGGTIFTLKKY